MGAVAHLEQRYTTQSTADVNDINNMSNEDTDSILTNVLMNCDREKRASGKENCQVRLSTWTQAIYIPAEGIKRGCEWDVHARELVQLIDSTSTSGGKSKGS
jgi:hypothetical protein